METQGIRISRLEEMMSQMVDNQTTTLRLLHEHSVRLGNVEKLLAKVVDELVEIKKILASPRSMGFAPESGQPE